MAFFNKEAETNSRPEHSPEPSLAPIPLRLRHWPARTSDVGTILQPRTKSAEPSAS